MDLIQNSYIINPNKQLDYFQVRGISGINGSKSIYSLIKRGKKNILAVSPGGSGKTVMQAKVSYDYITTTTKDVAIFVHRRELLNHSRIELDEWYGIYSQRIDDKTKNISSGTRVFVCMVETFDRRSIESFLKYFDNVGLYMIDECHLQHFNKIFKRFPEAIRIGWTATPISANKLEPLIFNYDDIIVMATIPELIELNRINPKRGIVSCYGHDFTIDIGVKKDQLKKNKKGEYIDSVMGTAFSGARQIQNTLSAIEKHGKNAKGIIFNANIEHSLEMHNAMLYYGFNSQHIDSDSKSKYSSDSHRKFIFGDGLNHKGWLNEIDKGFLNNVGIATIGTDVKSVNFVGVNKRTTSFTLFWQMVFRANRAYVDEHGVIKEYFTLVDTGNNMLGSDYDGEGHGVYYDEDNFNWEFIFRNPKLPKQGSTPIKSCPECGAINTAQTRVCSAKILSPLDDEETICGYIFEINEQEEFEDIVIREMILVSDIVKSKVSVQKTIDYINNSSLNVNSGFYKIIEQCCNVFRIELETKKVVYLSQDNIEINQVEFEEIYKTIYNKVCEWFKVIGSKKWINHKVTIRKEIVNKLTKLNIIFPKQEIEEIDNNYSYTENHISKLDL